MNQYKSETTKARIAKKEIIIGGLFIISFIVQVVLTGFQIKQSFMSALVQFLSSWILAFVFVQFRRKYYGTSLFAWWTGIYIVIIILSVIASLILDF